MAKKSYLNLSFDQSINTEPEDVGEFLRGFQLSSTYSENEFAAKHTTSSHGLELADHLKRPVTGKMGSLYHHHGIYVGNGHVIDFNDVGVRMKSLNEFLDGHENECEIVYTRRNFSRKEICHRAFALFTGEEKFGSYNSALNNCEHFAIYCITGEKSSSQTNNTISGILNLVGLFGKILLDDVLDPDSD